MYMYIGNDICGLNVHHLWSCVTVKILTLAMLLCLGIEWLYSTVARLYGYLHCLEIARVPRLGVILCTGYSNCCAVAELGIWSLFHPRRSVLLEEVDSRGWNNAILQNSHCTVDFSPLSRQ